MYHYAANNPVRYIDPDGRVVGNKETQDGLIKINKIFNSLKKIIIPQSIRNIVSSRNVQFSKIEHKRMDCIGDYNYIATSSSIQKHIIADLNESAENPELLVTSITWFEEDTGLKITEYAIYNYDKDNNKSYGSAIRIYIGNDGYIDYARDVYYDWTKDE